MNDNIHVVILTPALSSRLSWMLVPAFLERAARFSYEYDPASADIIGAVLRDFQNNFGSHLGDVLGLAVWDPDEALMVGHLLASIEHVRGIPFAFVHQWAKDVTTGRELDDLVVQVLAEWAMERGAKFVRALPLDDARARLFKRYGFYAGGALLTKELHHG